MKLAIVGTTINLSDNEERDMRQLIALTLKHYDVNETLVISGGAKGVDTLGIEIAKSLGFQTKVFKPEINDWEPTNKKIGFKYRNIQIAKECDALFCFTVQVHKTKCYHHTNLQEHEKTAGCWTGLKVIELGKPFDLIVMNKS